MVVAIIALPLFASLITGLFNKVINKNTAHFLTSSMMVIATLIATYIFYRVGIKGEIIHLKLVEWLNISPLKADWALYVDQLTSIMLIVITSVSAVVHIYSGGYMHEDQNLPRFMSYLSLFTVCMLMLVMSDNFIQLFFGWEGVGLCSYLLIGFWYEKRSANLAATKAFVVNRVGDFAFILGIILIYINFGSVEFAEVFPKISSQMDDKLHLCCMDVNLIEAIALLLFIGSMGKSAQIGLHVWLPDAMEGPTPVSALIHAATMVTAGVFLVARTSYLFEYAPMVREFIVIIGSTTCLFAAIIALCQNDIKKIIAYSTCSQLGYMFMACGLSSYQAGVFHLFTHAFFKAMLFLAAGSVIHAVHEQDIRKMGGLRKHMPITYALFWLGSFAIMGIFPFSGYYSKDLILNAAYLANSNSGDYAYYFGIIAAFCTAVYSIKIIVKTFHGEFYGNHHRHDLESPTIMNAPLIILVLGSCFAGFIGAKILNMETPLTGFFKTSIFIKTVQLDEHIPFEIEYMPTIVAIAGMIVGYALFATRLSDLMSRITKPIYHLVLNKFYFDEIYGLLFVKVNDCLANILKIFDKKIIDFFGPALSACISLSTSRRVASIHSGMVSFYALMMVLGMVVALSILVFKYVL